MRKVMDGDDLRRALRRIAHEIVERNRGVADVIVLGVRTRGAPLAERLADLLSKLEDAVVPFGSLDVALYRDDLDRRPTTPLGTTNVPVDVDDAVVVLVDDVLYTGRTARAALDAVVDLGRPRRVQLVALIDRGHREVPIRPDYVGRNLPTAATEHVQVRLTEIDDSEGVWVGVPGEEQ